MNRASYWAMVLLFAVLFAILRTFDPRATIAEILILFACVPRLHDVGRSGWWAGGVIIGEFVVLLPLLATSEDTILTVGGLYVILIALLMIILGCLPGQAGENRFGPAPKPGLNWSPSRAQASAPTRDEQAG